MELEEEQEHGAPEFHGSIGRLIKKVRTECANFQSSAAPNDEIQSLARDADCGLKIVLDVETRWNSTLPSELPQPRTTAAAFLRKATGPGARYWIVPVHSGRSSEGEGGREDSRRGGEVRFTPLTSERDTDERRHGSPSKFVYVMYNDH